ncbi:tail assembly protein, putative [Rhodovulum sp. P5]|uniref:minor tail protein n=1 Tax=Rhodovulum phage vB_RhkS_P1 TaxID=1873452 RepID=UPI00080AB09F|nr:NlpC/P60 family protein [Rhodovulum sp. P5]YP_009285935.1 minor tail protein [Rhodovulum phage vB_RhkS_P1]ANT39921.1 putative tail assembly protein [Rhodovulum phage vB_RhkS_P1]ARE38989.1 tail assembly protein, putative [Rhodovulum sp. P5]
MIGDWVGLPYAEGARGPEAYDCLGLFLALQRVRMGRLLPDPGCSIPGAVRHDVVDGLRPQWRRVEAAAVAEGDALLFRHRGRVLHVGYALDTRDMLHTDGQFGASTIERWSSSLWLPKLEGCYRAL